MPAPKKAGTLILTPTALPCTPLQRSITRGQEGKKRVEQKHSFTQHNLPVHGKSYSNTPQINQIRVSPPYQLPICVRQHGQGSSLKQGRVQHVQQPVCVRQHGQGSRCGSSLKEGRVQNEAAQLHPHLWLQLQGCVEMSNRQGWHWWWPRWR
jgi:hypothetical protein